MIYLFIIVWLSYWSAESGASLPWSKKWQDNKKYYSELPELIIALTIASIAIYGWGLVFNIGSISSILLWIVFVAVSYAGKQSATWGYLQWDGYTKDLNRQSKLRKWNDWLASKFNFRLGDEGYSWVWAFTKGFITTLPVLGLGCIFQPLCREVSSHAEGRLKGDSNMYMELSDGIAYGLACVAFLIILSGMN